LLTGDTVERRADGTLRFHGRTDDIIKSGAYRLGPAEIEAAILRHGDVAECAAIGIPDAIRGEVVAAVVRLRTGSEVDHVGLTAALQHLVRNEVGAHAYPRLVRVVDQLPRTTSNKIDRGAVRRSMLEGAP
jgi:acetyl-CoA synthetase